MNPVRIIIESTGKEVGWACSKCGTFFSNLQITGGGAREDAEKCCVPRICACEFGGDECCPVCFRLHEHSKHCDLAAALAEGE